MDRCIVIQDKHGDRHADDLADGADLGAAAIALAREVGCETGEAITYWVVASDDPGAARLTASHESIAGHYITTIPARCGACEDTGVTWKDAWSPAHGHTTPTMWCSCSAGAEAREDHEVARAEAREDAAW